MPVIKERTLWPSEEKQAFRKWIMRYPGLHIDCSLSPFLGADRRFDWLRSVREALMLSQESIAKKMNVSINAYSKLENNEERMSIKLATLSKAADAMGCELVYAIRPKTGQKFSQLIWDVLLRSARTHPRVKLAPDEYQAMALSATASELLDSTHFRLQNGWVEKRPNRRSRGR